MHVYWLMLGTVMILGIAAEGVQIVRNGRRKRRAHELRLRAMAAQKNRA